MKNKNLINLKSSEVKDFRNNLLKIQNFKDAITGKPIDINHAVLDHQHKNKKSDINGVNGNGLVRGVLDTQVNCCEGKIWNATKRYLGHTTPQERIIFLKQLINYYQRSIDNPTNFVHPSEVQKEKELSKKNFNKLNKLYINKYNKKPLEFPKSKKMTKLLEPLYTEFNIDPYNSHS